MTRHTLGADLTGDMPAQFGRRRIKGLEPRGDDGSRVVADQDNVRSSAGIDHFDWRRVDGREHNRRGVCML